MASAAGSPLHILAPTVKCSQPPVERTPSSHLGPNVKCSSPCMTCPPIESSPLSSPWAAPMNTLFSLPPARGGALRALACADASASACWSLLAPGL
eukprot:scaffold9940_cov104-Isochrysis_galbana.AAC.5